MSSCWLNAEALATAKQRKYHLDALLLLWSMESIDEALDMAISTVHSVEWAAFGPTP